MTPVVPWAEIDPFIESFERARSADPSADPGAFLPPADHPHASLVLVELLRADMEFGWSEARPHSLGEYLARFPALRGNVTAIEQLAFEEFRLRRVAGQDPNPADYATHYKIDTRGWPRRLADAETDGSFPTAPTGRPLPETVPCEFHCFRLERELGRGSFGRVYLATQKELADRPVVLKLATDLRDEPETLARVQHTNIVPIYSVHRVGPVHAFCMPFFGTTTAGHVLEAIRKSGEVPASGRWFVELLASRREGPAVPSRTLDRLAALSHVDAVLFLVARLAGGLAHAHERGVLHQDLKPANVLLADDGEPMLLDFNLARIAGASGGTLAYMSPERLDAFRANRAFSDARDDVYALGLILYELLGGRAGATGVSGTPDQVAEQLAAERRQPPRDLRTRNPNVTPAVASIVAKCLAGDAAKRYASASDLRTDLEHQLAHEPLRFAPDPSPRERFRKWRRRHPRLASASGVGIAAFVVLAVVGGLFTLRTIQLARAEATNALHDFRGHLAASELLLSSPDPKMHDIKEGLNLAGQARARFAKVSQATDFVNAIQSLPLPEVERAKLRAEYTELFLLTARGEHMLAARTTDPTARRERLNAAMEWNERAEKCAGDREAARSVRLQRAWLLALMGRTPEAHALVEESDSQGEPDSPRMLRAIAGRHMDNREFRKAADLLRRANRADPANPLGWFLLGTCHEQLRQFTQAVGCYDVTVALRPESHLPYYRRAAALAQAREHEEAILDFTRALELHPDYAPAYIDRAHSRAARGDTKSAIADLNEALKLEDAPTSVYFLRADWRAQLQDATGAAEDRRTGLERTPRDELSWVARGYARLPGDTKGALADFDAALAINPTSAPALENKASVLSEMLNRPEEALKVLDTLVAANPDYVLGRSGRAVVLARMGRRTAALADAKAAEALSTEGLVLYQIACVYALNSKTTPADRAEALRYLRRALAANVGQEYLANDSDLNNLRGDPVFEQIRKEHQAKR